MFDGQLLICPGYIKGRVSGPHLPPHTRGEARHGRGRREPGGQQPDSGPGPGSRHQLADWGASLQSATCGPTLKCSYITHSQAVN